MSRRGIGGRCSQRLPINKINQACPISKRPTRPSSIPNVSGRGRRSPQKYRIVASARVILAIITIFVIVVTCVIVASALL